MTQSWVIYSITTGQIVCWGRNIDVEAEQILIDAGDTSCTLYLIQQILGSNTDLSCLYCDCSDSSSITQFSGVDHALQEIVGLSLVEIKKIITKRSNEDILHHFTTMHNLDALISEISGAIPTGGTIKDAIKVWCDGLEIAKSTITSQISSLATTESALQYYGSRSWLMAFPPAVEWGQM